MPDTLHAAQLRDLRVDFWFEPPLALSDAFWPAALVVTWIAWRNEALALHHLERLRTQGRAYWMSHETDGLQVHPREAESLLLEALRSGTVSAYGLVEERERRLIGRHEWIDLRLFGLRADDKLDSAVWSGDRSVRYSDLCVAGAEVLAAWPKVGQQPNNPPARKAPGPTRELFIAVCEAMRRQDSATLNGHKVETLQSMFGANRETCRQARLTVNAERQTDKS